jgi:hypothetical protein
MAEATARPGRRGKLTRLLVATALAVPLGAAGVAVSSASPAHAEDKRDWCTGVKHDDKAQICIVRTDTGTLRAAMYTGGFNVETQAKLEWTSHDGSQSSVWSTVKKQPDTWIDAWNATSDWGAACAYAYINPNEEVGNICIVVKTVPPWEVERNG